MSVKNPLTFKESTSSEVVRYRWFVENCTQIRLENGKVIVIDPCFPKEDEALYENFGSPFSVDDIDACDYIIINHTHSDHVWSIGELARKFNPYILVNAFSAQTLCKAYAQFVELNAMIDLEECLNTALSLLSVW